MILAQCLLFCRIRMEFFFVISDKVSAMQHWRLNDNSIWLSEVTAYVRAHALCVHGINSQGITFTFYVRYILLWSEISIYSRENYPYCTQLVWAINEQLHLIVYLSCRRLKNTFLFVIHNSRQLSALYACVFVWNRKKSKRGNELTWQLISYTHT